MKGMIQIRALSLVTLILYYAKCAGYELISQIEGSDHILSKHRDYHKYAPQEVLVVAGNFTLRVSFSALLCF